jgi:prepilin-type processing-associated H-X9-DG protein
VGIGTTSVGTKLNIRSDASDDGILLEKSDGTDIARLFHDGTSTNARFDMFSGGSATVQIKASGDTHFSGGNVGIGTSSPVGRLSVIGTDNTTQAVFGGATGTTGRGLRIAIDQRGGTFNLDAILDAQATVGVAGNLVFQTQSIERVRIDASGGLITKPAAGGHAVFNENSVDADFRVESNGNANMLFVDGGNDAVGIGTNVAGNSTLEVRSTGVDGTFANAIGFQYSGNSDEANTISTSVSSTAGSSGFKFNVSDGGGSSGKTSVLKITRADMVVNDDSNDIDFRVESDANTHALFVQGSDGNVGIGTASPLAKLHIYDGANATEATAQLKIEGAGYAGFHWLNGTAYYIGQNSNGRQLRMYSGSDVGVGVFLTNGGNSWSSYSDERLKENIADIGSVTEKIKDIRCVTYNRKDVDDENKHETIGFIAQDFVGKFDQVLDDSKVSDTDEETRYSIRYTETIPILMKAIQEQQTLIESLTARITTLEG